MPIPERATPRLVQQWSLYNDSFRSGRYTGSRDQHAPPSRALDFEPSGTLAPIRGLRPHSLTVAGAAQA